MSQTNPLKKMSDTLTEESDVQVTGVDTVVTKGPKIEGNEITVRAHGDDDDEVLLGFETEEFEHFVDRMVSNSERDWEVDD